MDWTYKDEDPEHFLTKEETERADAICRKLANIKAMREEESWEEDDGDYGHPCAYGCTLYDTTCDETGCQIELEQLDKQHNKEADRALEEEWLLHQLDQMNLRVVRPYELPGNEDEKLMEYLERDRD